MAKKKIEAKDFISAMNTTAEKLSATRKALNEREAKFKSETDGLYADEANLKTELLEALKAIGLSSVKTAGGDSYSISHKQRFLVKNPLLMETYARENRCVTVNKVMLNQRFTTDFKKGTLPDFVEAEPYETISIRNNKTAEVAEESG